MNLFTRSILLLMAITLFANAEEEKVRYKVPSYFIEDSLKEANYLFRERHMTKPRGHSAYDYYLKVLREDPDNIRAKKGIDNIIDWFMHRMKELAKQKNWNKVSIYANSVLYMDPYNIRAQDYYEIAQANHSHHKVYRKKRYRKVHRKRRLNRTPLRRRHIRYYRRYY